MEIIRSRPVDKPDRDVITNTVDVLVPPVLEWIRWLRGSLASTIRMTVDFVRWAVDNVNVPSIRLPALPARTCQEMLVCECDSQVMLYLERILCRARRWIPHAPKTAG